MYHFAKVSITINLDGQGGGEGHSSDGKKCKMRILPIGKWSIDDADGHIAIAETFGESIRIATDWLRS